jgi:hypothetical protein
MDPAEILSVEPLPPAGSPSLSIPSASVAPTFASGTLTIAPTPASAELDRIKLAEHRYGPALASAYLDRLKAVDEAKADWARDPAAVLRKARYGMKRVIAPDSKLLGMTGAIEAMLLTLQSAVTAGSPFDVVVHTIMFLQDLENSNSQESLNKKTEKSYSFCTLL